MDELNYLVYDCGNLIAGFVSLCTTVEFIQNWRGNNSPIAINMVDAHTGEVVDTYQDGEWENVNY